MNPPTIPTSAFRRRQPLPPPPPCRSSNSNELIKTTVTATNIESFPDELLFDILARLPAEFLLHISSLVCRKWRRIIHSDAFADAQNTIQQLSSSAYGLLFSPLPMFKARPQSIYATATSGRIETYNLDKDRGIIISCCNGLALETLTSLHVVNPLTKKSLLLPSFSFQKHRIAVYHAECGIGYSAASMKYKVTLPYTYHVEGAYHMLIGLAILTVGVDKSWRHVELPGPLGDLRDLLFDSPLSSEGFLHWGRDGDCLTLNVETEIFTASKIPNINRFYCTYLSTGRHLSVLVGDAGDFCWDIWEMQSGEWRKLEYDIDLGDQKEKLQQFGRSKGYHNIPYLDPIGWVKYPQILVFRFRQYVRRSCVFYNLETHEITTIELHGDDGEDGGCDFMALVHRNNLLHEVV